jgi:uncharacterized membrane protein YfcA
MNFPLDIGSALMAFGIAALGAVLQGSVGFGLGLLSVPLLILINPVFIPGPLLLAAFFLNLLISRRERMSIDFNSVKWAVPGRILGSIVGAGLLTLIPQGHLSVLFGFMVLIAVGISLRGWEMSLSPWNIFGAGIFSGFMGTTSAVGGAPMALVFQRQTGSWIRGTLSVIFAVGTVISMLSLFVIGKFGWEEIQAASVLFPAIVLGFFLSHQTARILDRGFIRIAVLITSAGSGFFVILRSLL